MPSFLVLIITTIIIGCSREPDAMRAQISYNRSLTFEFLQSMKQDLKSVASDIIITGMESSSFVVVCHEERAAREALSCDEIQKQVKAALRIDGLVFSSNQDTLRIGFQDCLYTFDKEYQILLALNVKNQRNETLHSSHFIHISFALDNRHRQALDEYNEPVVELRFRTESRRDVSKVIEHHLKQVWPRPRFRIIEG